MRTLLSALALLPALGLAAGCDPVLFSAEVDAPEICISGLRVPFPPSGYTGSTDHPIAGEDLGFPDGDDFEIDVSVRSVGIIPTVGVDDLSFIDALSVRAVPADPASDLGDLMLVEMNDANHMNDGSMYAEPREPANIADHLRGGDVLFKFDLAGDLPDVLWETEMDLCVHAVARYEKPL
jgi:hypothetical protein